MERPKIELADIIRRHGTLLAAHFGEDKGMRDIRKHVGWYLHGFSAGSELRRALALVKTLDGQFDEDLSRSARIEPRRWENRSVVQRVAETAVAPIKRFF